MIRRSIGTVCGLGLVVAVACGDGGAPNDFGAGPSDNAPRAPRLPRLPNAPPGDADNPPPSAQPPPPNGIPGTEPPPVDCFDLCADARAAGCDIDDENDDCEGQCERAPAHCLEEEVALLRCFIGVGCNEDFAQDCIDELERLDICQAGDPPDPGQGGQGPQ